MTAREGRNFRKIGGPAFGINLYDPNGGSTNAIESNTASGVRANTAYRSAANEVFLIRDASQEAEGRHHAGGDAASQQCEIDNPLAHRACVRRAEGTHGFVHPNRRHRTGNDVRHSIVIAGHETSVSLEDAFWRALKDIATTRRMTLSNLTSGAATLSDSRR